MTTPSDAELRALVREAIARVFAREPAVSKPAQTHASHRMLPLRRGGDGDGACLIEPAVRCTGCGYCLSYGH
jgi:hypothetical protein